jgi:hypothetical protein
VAACEGKKGSSRRGGGRRGGGEEKEMDQLSSIGLQPRGKRPKYFELFSNSFRFPGLNQIQNRVEFE